MALGSPAVSSSVSAATVAYLAPEGVVDPITKALGKSVVALRDRLVLATEPCEEAAWWAANVWHDLQQRRISSIGDGKDQCNPCWRT